jgi:Cys-tRNA synthase (O-phospho-L-seryl-tRNA:Cys-tRNA synthase)
VPQRQLLGETEVKLNNPELAARLGAIASPPVPKRIEEWEDAVDATHYLLELEGLELDQLAHSKQKPLRRINQKNRTKLAETRKGSGFFRLSPIIIENLLIVVVFSLC